MYIYRLTNERIDKFTVGQNFYRYILMYFQLLEAYCISLCEYTHDIWSCKSFPPSIISLFSWNTCLWPVTMLKMFHWLTKPFLLWLSKPANFVDQIADYTLSACNQAQTTQLHVKSSCSAPSRMPIPILTLYSPLLNIFWQFPQHYK